MANLAPGKILCRNQVWEGVQIITNFFWRKGQFGAIVYMVHKSTLREAYFFPQKQSETKLFGAKVDFA